MSRNTARATVRAEDLVEELSLGAAVRLKCESDDIHHVVRAVVEYLVVEYRSQDFYIPSGFGSRELPMQEIRQAMTSGESVRSICNRYRTDRRTLYRKLSEQDE